MKKLFVSVTAVVFVFMAVVAFAQAPGSGPATGPSSKNPEGYRGPGPQGGPRGQQGVQPGWGHFHGGLGESWLGLSKDQIDKMQALRDRFYNDTRDVRYDMAQKRLEMRKLFMDPKTDDATLLAKQKEMSGLRQKLQDRMAQMMVEGRKILTPEQLQKLDRSGMGPGGGMGFGMGPGMGYGWHGGMMGHGGCGGPGGHGMMGRGMGPGGPGGGCGLCGP